MKKILLYLLLLLTGRVSAQEGFLSISSIDKTYSVKYPKNWTAKAEKYGENSFINIKAPGSDGLITGIARSPLPPNIKTLDQLVAQQTAEMKKEMGVKAFSENRRVGNRHILAFDFDARGKKIMMKYYLWIDKSVVYAANYGGETLEFMANKGEAETIIKSIGAAMAETASPAATGKPGTEKTASLVDIDCRSISSFSNLVAKGPAGIVPVEKYGSLKLSNNKDFQVEVSDGKFYSLEKEKKELKENQVNVFQKYIVEEPNGIIYHSEVMSSRPEYHFKYFLKTENGSYFFQDVKGPLYDLDAVKTMYQAAKESRVQGKGQAVTSNQNEAAKPVQQETPVQTEKEKDGAKKMAAAVLETAPAMSNNRGVAVAGSVAAGALGKLGKKKENQPKEQPASSGVVPNIEPENGPYEGRDEAGNLIEKGQFANGKKNGKWIRYTNAVVTSEIEYLNGKKNGKRIEYFNNGNKDFEENYVDGVLDGVRLRYSMSAGTVIQKWTYKNGDLDGEYKMMTDNGVTLEEGLYANDKKEGMWKFYERNGTLKNTKMYSKGKLVE